MTTEQIEMVADKLYAAYEGILSRLEELRVKHNEEFAKFSKEDLEMVKAFDCWQDVNKREKLALDVLYQNYNDNNAEIVFTLWNINFCCKTRTQGSLSLRTTDSWIDKRKIVGLGVGMFSNGSFMEFVSRRWRLDSDDIFEVKHLAEKDWTPFCDWMAGVMSAHLTAVSTAIAEAHRRKDEATNALLAEFGLTDGGARHISYRYSFKREEV